MISAFDSRAGAGPKLIKVGRRLVARDRQPDDGRSSTSGRWSKKWNRWP
jgi:hypothetical protein